MIFFNITILLFIIIFNKECSCKLQHQKINNDLKYQNFSYINKEFYNFFKCFDNKIKVLNNTINENLSKVYIKNNLNNTYNKLNLKIISKEDTLDKIIYYNKSIARFGDYEYEIILGRSVSYQKFNKTLSDRLKTILKSNERNLLIGVNDALNKNFIDKYYKRSAKKFWGNYVKKNEKALIKLHDRNKQYYSSGISRFYIEYEDKSKTSLYVKKLKKVWEKKDIVIIEGVKSRLGVGNDLFNNAKSIQRILCPSENAFNVYNKILNEAYKIPKNKQILIALGPTATVLAYDLCMKGYQAIDIGHVDIEYEWFLRKVKNKIKIENKYTNEAKNGRNNIKPVEDTNYYKQIIFNI